MKRDYTTRPRKLVFIAIAVLYLAVTPSLLNQTRSAWPITTVEAQTGQAGVNQQREDKIREHEAQMKNLDLERTRSRDPQVILAQVNEDFNRIKALNAEVIQANITASAPDYKAITEATDEIKKRAVRLKANLALPASGKEEKRSKGQTDEQLKSQLTRLNDVISKFAANPVFKGTGAVDPQLGAQARLDLESIIDLSDRLKKDVEKFSKIR